MDWYKKSLRKRTTLMPKGIPKNGLRIYKKPNPSWYKKGRPENCAWYGKKRPELYNEKNPMWKGDKAHYTNKHHWVRRRLGRPTQCEHCKKHFVYPHIHWASISGKCLRVLSDWIRLCVSCHKKYDLEKIKLKKQKYVTINQ